jgi:hypothetical protein
VAGVAASAGFAGSAGLVSASALPESLHAASTMTAGTAASVDRTFLRDKIRIMRIT